LAVVFTIREGRIRAVTAYEASRRDAKIIGNEGDIEMPLSIERKRRIVVPRFASSAAEAAWFDKNQRVLAADMRRRFKTGEGKALGHALAQSATKEKARLKPVTIRMLPGDLDLVRRLAI
jgi:hypothetical protein